MNKNISRWCDPSLALFIGLLACLIRVAIKLGVGFGTHSPLLSGDGFHNIGDAGYLLAAFLIMWIVKWKRDVMHAGENMGVMFQFAVAWILAVFALFIGYQSLLGLFPCETCESAVRSVFPFIPKFTARKLETDALYAIVIALGASVAISYGAAKYHIHAGKVSGYGTLVTIGKETQSDMLVECLILGGIIGEYFFGQPRIEYFGGIIVAGLIFRTAWELFIEANDSFLQVSIGGKFVEDITALVGGTRGIERIVKLEVYRILQAVRVKVWVETGGGAEANEDIQDALMARIRAYANEHGFSECRPDVFFSIPDDHWHREVYAIVKDHPLCFVAPTLLRATHLRICDVEHGEVVSGEDIPAPKNEEVLIALLKQKHVRTYRSWCEGAEIRAKLSHAEIVYSPTPTLNPPS